MQPRFKLNFYNPLVKLNILVLSKITWTPSVTFVFFFFFFLLTLSSGCLKKKREKDDVKADLYIIILSRRFHKNLTFRVFYFTLADISPCLWDDFSISLCSFFSGQLVLFLSRFPASSSEEIFSTSLSASHI